MNHYLTPDLERLQFEARSYLAHQEMTKGEYRDKTAKPTGYGLLGLAGVMIVGMFL